MYLRISINILMGIPVCTVSQIANYRRLVAVNHGMLSRSTDGSKSGWRQRSVVVVVVVIVCAVVVVAQ